MVDHDSRSCTLEIRMRVCAASERACISPYHKRVSASGPGTLDPGLAPLEAGRPSLLDLALGVLSLRWKRLFSQTKAVRRMRAQVSKSLVANILSQWLLV